MSPEAGIYPTPIPPDLEKQIAAPGLGWQEPGTGPGLQDPYAHGQVASGYPNTLIAVVLDESGSMGPQTNDVIESYEKFLGDQRALPDPARLFLTRFSTVVGTPSDPVAIVNAQTLKGAYRPDGFTALLDAVADSIRHAEKHRQVNERVLVLIITDGEENHSRRTSYDEIAKLIADHEKLGFWTFTYIGPNADAWAHRTGTARGSTRHYQDAKSALLSMSTATAQYRCSAAPQSRDFYAGAQDNDPLGTPGAQGDLQKGP